MGKHGTAPALLLSGAGYWVEPPPVTRERMSEILGAPITDDAWREIEKAFQDHQATVVHSSAAVRAAKYRKGRDQAKQGIADALEATKTHAWSETTRAMQRMARASPRGAAGMDCDITGHLAQAAQHLAAALSAIRIAEPVEMKIPTAPDANALLVRRLRAILERAGMPVAISKRGDSTRAIEAVTDLAQFERLVLETKVHEAVSSDALAAWVAAALRKGSRRKPA